MILKKILKDVNVIKTVNKNMNLNVTGITDNSMEIKQENMFIAKKGEKLDSHQFIENAVNNGAVCIIITELQKKYFDNVTYVQVEPENIKKIIITICKNFYNNPDKKLKIVGVTGTNGKTTTVLCLKNILDKCGHNTFYISTIKAGIGKKKFSINNTTPGALEYYKLLNIAVINNADIVVMEISSHAIAQYRLDISEVDIAVFTNLSKEHLDYHKTMKNYAETKALLFSGMKKNGYAVINNDNKYSELIINKCNTKKIITFGLNSDCDIYSMVNEISIENTEFNIIDNDNKITINSKLIGKHNIYNLTGVYCVCKVLGINQNDFVNKVSKLKVVSGRLDRVENNKNINIFVDYAHTPDALDNILSLLKEVTKGKIITVIGCGGDRDKTKRPEIGKIAVVNSGFVILTSDNPRTENPDKIIKDIEKGCVGYKNYIIEPDRKKAINKAIQKYKKNDVIIVAGKGHETYQIIGEKKYSFNDKKIIKGMLN